MNSFLYLRLQFVTLILFFLGSFNYCVAISNNLNQSATKVTNSQVKVEKNPTVSNPDQWLSKLGIIRGKCDKRTGLSEYRLKSNGLTILLDERHSSPVVTVMMLYKVGSRNEAVGYTGATHFLEHMMFRGSLKYDPLTGRGIEDILKPIGGLNNATTWFDRTSYFEVVPSSNLPLCLDFEADRMRHLLLRKSDHDSEMTVVRNELEKNENQARTLLETQLFATAYMEHPYHHPTIGWRCDVEKVPLARLKQFYDDFYWPNNAALLIVGDFQPEQALKTVAEKFSKVPHSPHPISVVYTVEPPQEGERRFVVQRGTELPKVMVAFHTCRAADSDIYALAVIEALLGDNNRQSSRLYKNLIDSGIASEAYAFSYELRDPGLFVVSATGVPDASQSKIEQTILAELEKLKTQPVIETELKRAKTTIIKNMLLSTTDPLSLAELIGESISAVNWQYWTTYPDRIQAVTDQDIMRVARKYFVERNCTVGYYLPQIQPKFSAQQLQSLEPAPPAGVSSIVHLKSGAYTNKTAVPRTVNNIGTIFRGNSLSSKVVRKVLANGLSIEVLPIKGTGTVSIAGKIQAGDYFANTEKTLVPAALAQMLTKGSSRYSREDIANTLDDMGTSLEFEAGNFWVNFESDVVSDDLAKFLSLLSDILKSPALPDEELQKSKKIFISSIKQYMADTHEAARNALSQALYKPGCVYYEKSFEDQLLEIPTLTIEDLREFHQTHYGPANMTIAIVGDVLPEAVFKLLEAELGTWQGAPKCTISVPKSFPQSVSHYVKVDIPDKQNVDITIGHPVLVGARSKDYFAALVGNAALGYSPFSTRLSPVREKYGYSYNVYSTFLDTAYGGAPWVIECTANPDNVILSDKLIKRLTNDYVKNGITLNEISLEGKHIAGEFLVDLRNPGEIAQYLTKFEMLGLGPQFLDEFPRQLQQVGKLEVNQAIRKYFSLDHTVTVVSGSVSKISGIDCK